MGWARHDDGRHENPKLIRAGLEADGLHSRMTTYSSRHETDGFVDEVIVEGLARVKHWRKVVEALEREGLAEYDGQRGGWWVHDYLDYNPAHAELETRRRKERERKAHQSRNTDGRITSGSDADSARIPRGSDADSASATSDGSTVPIPSHPIPSPPVDVSDETSTLGDVPSAPRRGRTRNPVFEVICEVSGYVPGEMTEDEHGRASHAEKQLREVSPDEIRRRAANYALRFPDTVLSPQALTRNWTACGIAPTSSGLRLQQSRSLENYDAVDMATRSGA